MPAFFNAHSPMSGELSPSEELDRKLQNINEKLADQPQPTTPAKPTTAEVSSSTKEPLPTPTLTKEIPEIAKPVQSKPETPPSSGNAVDATTWQDVSKTSFS